MKNQHGNYVEFVQIKHAEMFRKELLLQCYMHNAQFSYRRAGYTFQAVKQRKLVR